MLHHAQWGGCQRRQLAHHRRPDTSLEAEGLAWHGRVRKLGALCAGMQHMEQPEGTAQLRHTCFNPNSSMVWQGW